jgi:hypothetical protein
LCGNIRRAGDNLAIDHIEDADAAVAVDEVDHVVPGRRHQFRVVEHDMRALGAADESARATDIAIGAVDPRARGIDDHLRPHLAAFAGDLVAQRNTSRPTRSPHADVIHRVRPGTRGLSVLNQLQAQPLRIGDLGIVVSCGADHAGIQSGPKRASAARLERNRCRGIGDLRPARTSYIVSPVLISSAPRLPGLVGHSADSGSRE